MCKCRARLATSSALGVLMLTGHWGVRAAESTDTAQLSSGKQSVEEGIEEIVVQARKRDERLFDIPETITVISNDELRRAGVAGLDDLGRQTPNVVLNRRQDNEPNVVIRGIGAFGNTQGIGFYIDDVQNFTDQSARLEDLERVEVLKGPQGTLYGGSNVGGAVRYVSKKPEPELSGQLQLQAGELGTESASGALNIPLVGDTLLSRISAYSDRSDGFVRNDFLANNLDARQEAGARATFRFLPSERLEALLTLRYNELENGGNVYLRTDRITDYRRSTSLNEDVYNEREVAGGILQLNFATASGMLTSVSSFTRRNTRFLWDLDYSEVPFVVATEGDRHHTEVYTQELRLVSDDGGALDWLVGVYGARLNNKNTVLNADVGIGLEDGVLLLENFNDAQTVEEQYALFLDASYDIGAFGIDAGVRVNRASFEATLNNLGGEQHAVRDTSLLPKLSLSYDATDDLRVYGAIAKGYEPGKVNTAADAAFPYEHETALSYEIGVKGRAPDARVSYEVTGFFITYQDRQFETQVVDPQSGVIFEFIDNIGDSESYGIEGTVSWQPVRDLKLGVSAGYLHSTWKEALFQGERFDGNRAPYAPRFTGNASLDYETVISQALKMSFRADYSHQGGYFWDIRNLAKEPSHDIVNARIGIGANDGRWEFALRGENLSDERYWTEFNFGVFDTPDAQGGCDDCHLGAAGQRRRFLATFAFRF